LPDGDTAAKDNVKPVIAAMRREPVPDDIRSGRQTT
jgi:hypothetical protein